MQPASVPGTPLPPVSHRVARLANRSWFAFMMALLQLGSAITLICLTRYGMEAIIYSTPAPGTAVVWGYTCFLSSNLSAGHCQYAYALGAVSIVLSACLFMMQCVQCEDIIAHGARACEGVVDVLGFAWWLAGAIVLTMEANKIKGMRITLPNQSYRDGVLAMAWLSTALFFLMLCFTIGTGVRVRKALRSERQLDAAAEAKPVPLEAGAV